MNHKRGVVYLLHYDDGIPVTGNRVAKHYLGWSCKGRFKNRMTLHKQGKGAKFTAAMARRGFKFVVARVWFGNRLKEKRLRDRKANTRLCPICLETLKVK